MKLNRKLLIIIVSILALINVGIFAVNLMVPDDEIKPFVRFISKQELSQTEIDNLQKYGLDPVLSEQFKFALITPSSDKLQANLKEYNIMGSKSTVITDYSGKVVYEVHHKFLTKSELQTIAEKYKGK